jgi:tetrahydromethanopterin S-methyltransferase subunit G
MNEQTVTRGEFEELRRRMDATEERLHNGDVALALLRQRLDQIDTKLGEMSQTLQELRMKPARRWDSISQQVLTWVVTALLAYIAVKIGLK